MRPLCIGINKSIWQEAYNFSYYDPYFTKDGVSRGYSLFFRETDYGEFNIANFLTNSFGGGVQFGYPINEIERVGLNLNYEKTEIDEGSLPAREIKDFLTSEGNIFETLKAQIVWSRITLNRGLFPTNGSSIDIFLQSTIPGSDINYYKVNLRNKFYRPLGFADLVFGFTGELGFLES